MTDFDPNDDRFADMKRGPEENGNSLAAQGSAEMVGPLVSERPMGAQRLAVPRRSTPEILSEIKALGSAAGKDWYYRFPVKKKILNPDTGREEWTTDYIEGASIKLANDLARTFGNCDVDVRVVEDARSWVFYARFIDLQTGFSMTRPFQQRKNQESVRGNSDRQRDIAFQIGASKAIRNVICNALQTYADYALEQAQQSIVERFAKDLVGSRAKAGERTKERGWDLKRVERVIGKVLGEWLAPDLAKVSAMFKAIDDGMISYDECFPAPNAPAVDNPLGPSTRQDAPLTDEEEVALRAHNEVKRRKAEAEAASQAIADGIAKKQAAEAMRRAQDEALEQAKQERQRLKQQQEAAATAMAQITKQQAELHDAEGQSFLAQQARLKEKQKRLQQEEDAILAGIGHGYEPSAAERGRINQEATCASVADQQQERAISSGEERKEPSTFDEGIEQRMEEALGPRGKAASESKASEATKTAPMAETAQATSVGDPDPIQRGGYYQEALAYIANATVEGTLANWWKGQRSTRLSAGMSAKQMQDLTDQYWSRHIALSEA